MNLIKKKQLIALMLAMFLFPFFTVHTYATNPVAEKHNTSANKIITGKVTDSAGEGLIGVSVTIKGTTHAAITDLEGVYTIDANDDAILGWVLFFDFPRF